MQNKKVTRYILQRVTSTSVNHPQFSAAETVNKLLDSGWQPWGSPFDTEENIFQAFVKYED